MPHYFDSHPTSAERPASTPFHIDGRDYVFETAGGVFSSHRVDFGTVLLIEAAIADLRAAGAHKGRLLDLGCGYGPVGIVLKRTFPAMEVVFTDVNDRALRLAKANAEHNKVAFANYIRSDGFEKIEGVFDFILTNPPIRAGKETVRRFFEGAHEHLNASGVFYAVLQKKQGAPSATEYLENLFGNCKPIDKSAGYRVLKCVK